MLRTPSDLGGSRVVVTGASSGIGRATAVALAERGARVTLAARSRNALKDVAQQCRDRGGEAVAVPTDVSDGDAVESLAARAAEEYGLIDAWVSAAAVMTYGRFEDTPARVHRRVIETNLIGPIECARAVLPYFRERGRGILVNVASQYGRITSPSVSAYVVSKFGMIGFSEVLRQELADVPGIEVVTILPGSVDTPIFRHAGNYVGRQPRPIPPVAHPDRVVRAILRALVAPKAEITVGQFARLLSVAHSVAPGLYDRLVPRVMAVAGYRRGSVPTGPGNVFEPTDGHLQVTGGWRRRRQVTLAALPVVAAAAALLSGRARVT